MKASDLIDTGLLPLMSRMILFSEIIDVPQDGWAVITGMGGGAGGTYSYTPGNSAPWGVKWLEVAAGDKLEFAIGAGGITTGNVQNVPANAGGTTFIRHNGVVVMTCQGGDAGPASATARSPIAAKVIGADYWMAGRQPVTLTGGAAVDLGAGTQGYGVAGDYSVDPSVWGRGVPAGYYFWPFDVRIGVATEGSPGVGAGRGASYSQLFGGGGQGYDAQQGGSPGRGASAGKSNFTPRDGGAGLGYLRLYKRI
jgi:hypothetical protein